MTTTNADHHALQGEGELGMGQDDTGQGELRLQALRKQLRRSAAQCDALKAELAEGKRRDRTADLYKKKVYRFAFSAVNSGWFCVSCAAPMTAASGPFATLTASETYSGTEDIMILESQRISMQALRVSLYVVSTCM